MAARDALTSEKMRRQLVALFEAGIRVLKLSPITLSVRANGAGDFYKRLKDGNLFFAAYSYDKAVAYFSTNWPEGEPWPDGVPRLDARDVPAHVMLRPRAPRKAKEATNGQA